MAAGGFSSWLWPSAVGLEFRRNSPPPRFAVSCSSPQPSPSSSNAKTLAAIQQSGVIACLRAPNAELAMQAATTALAAGIKVLEVVMTTPGVLKTIQQLVRDHPTAIIGAGTVLNANDARSAIYSGAKFLTSPSIVKDIINDVPTREALYIPGVMTPTEILSAHDAGAKIVKVYPVSALGGTQYLAALRKPFPHIPMVASQGITIDLFGEYIAQGASSVVLSDAIFDKLAMSQQNFEVIYQLAQIAALRGTEALKLKGAEFKQ